LEIWERIKKNTGDAFGCSDDGRKVVKVALEEFGTDFSQVLRCGRVEIADKSVDLVSLGEKLSSSRSALMSRSSSDEDGVSHSGNCRSNDKSKLNVVWFHKNGAGKPNFKFDNAISSTETIANER